MLYFKLIKFEDDKEVEREVIPCHAYIKLQKTNGWVTFNLKTGRYYEVQKRIKEDSNVAVYIENESGKTVDSYDARGGEKQ